ncbi:hypothetical protein APHAL10511_002508 [Amanita phalloides]|nr:hypothetical protein APHAL10511_002508 [Amanita phalloides]
MNYANIRSVLSQDPQWNSSNESTVLEPFHFVMSNPGKEVRRKLIEAFNIWLNVPNDQLKIIADVVSMFHTASLMVDDIEDDSQLRRGQPVAHKIYGIPQTINTANYVYFLAYQELFALRNNTPAPHDLDKIVTAELLSLHRGQGMEIFWRDSLRCPSEEEYINMVSQKTGGLLRIGIRLMMACATTNRNVDYVPLVNLIGVFFQIRDDYMNLQSTEYSNNKGFAEDLTEGKFSFPIVHSIHADTSNRQVLNVLQKRPSTPTLKLHTIEYLRKHTRSFEYTLSVLATMERHVREEIAKLGGNTGLDAHPTTMDTQRYIFFWKTNEKYGWASQWYYSPFTATIDIGGRQETVEFPTAEHWMMVHKALLFGDIDVAREILEIKEATSSNMAAVKALGRKVWEFKEEVWVAERERIVLEGNKLKFGQNEELRAKLLATGESELDPMPASSHRAKPPQTPSTNVWNVKKDFSIPQPTHSPSPPLVAPNAAHDPFVVRVFPNSDRNSLAVPTLDDSDDWPEVGKSSPHKPPKPPKPAEHPHPNPRKSEKKWIPLPADQWQAPPEPKTRPKNGHHSKTNVLNGSAPNASASQSRAHSGHNSVSQSASPSRINSRSGSVQSSPRIPRNKRLVNDDLDNLGAPHTDLQPYPENHPGASGHVPMAYPTPVYGPDGTLAPYYSRQHPSFPHHHRRSSAHSPSNASQGNTPPLYPPPPPLHYPGPSAPYPMYPPYPYDYGMTSPQQSYLYWNGGTESYPYPQTLRSPMQQYNAERPYVQQPARVPLPPEQSQAVAGYVPAVPLNDKNEKEKVMFGSIPPDSTRSPAPMSPPPSNESTTSEPKIEVVERMMTLFTIGMSASEAGSARLRSRTRSSKARSRTSLTGSPTAEPGKGAAEVKVIDLTDQETKWKFGFAEGEIFPPLPLKGLPSADAAAPETQASSSAVTPLSSISASLPFEVSLGDSIPPTQPGSANAKSAALPGTEDSDPFKIRDYGYGFGSGTNVAPEVAPDSKPTRERREKSEGEQEKEGGGERARDNRPRRGGGGYGNYGSYERGGHGGRRGRGPNSYPRGYNRGYSNRGGSQRHPPPPPQLSPSQFQPPFLPMGEAPNGYYHPPNQVPPFPYDAYPPTQFSSTLMHATPSASAPPMPAPQSQLSFPLDSTRYWLLGQLEYYLSSQNLAQDFYLRQQMDAKGWIPIITLASFNRVKNLTHDYQCVKDVLTLSSLLTVKHDWVRMHGWERFVLPNAAPSKVEPSDESGPEVGSNPLKHDSTDPGPRRNIDGTEHADAEEEEEEDVVFVMGKEASWSPQAARPHT